MTKRKPRFLLDVDGVLANFLDPAVEILNKLAGTNHKGSDLPGWDVFTLWDKSYEEAFFAECHRPGFCEALPVYPGAQEGFRLLSEVADVYIVTSPMQHPTWGREREVWLERHFGVHRDRIVSTGAKFLVSGMALVDDRPANLEAWAADPWNHLGWPILWAQSYNLTTARFYRTNQWADLWGAARSMSLGWGDR